MRILYFHQYFTTPNYNGGTRSYEMARRWVAAGHEVNLVTSSAYMPEAVAANAVWREMDIEGIRVHVIGSKYSNKQSFGARWREFVRFAYAAYRRARKFDADVVFASSTPLTIAIPGVLSSRRLGVPFVFEVRDLWPDVPIAIGALQNPVARSLARALECWAYRNARAVVALSEGMASRLADRNEARNKVIVVPNAADIELFTVDASSRLALRHRYPWLGDRPLVLYAGTLGIINEVEYMVTLACEVLALAPEVRFVVVGDGNRGDSVRSLAHTLGVAGVNMHFIDPMPKTDVAKWISAADVSFSFVADIPQLWDNSANKIFDAMAAGTCIGINYGGWQKDLIDREGVGIVLPAGDPKRAAVMLAAFLASPDEVAAAGDRARLIATSQFGRDLLADRLLTVLKNARK